MSKVTVLNRDGSPFEVEAGGDLNLNVKDNAGDYLSVTSKYGLVQFWSSEFSTDDNGVPLFAFDILQPNQREQLTTFARALLLHLAAPSVEEPKKKKRLSAKLAKKQK